MQIISADFHQEAGDFPSFYKHCVGAGRANELLRKASLEQLATTHDECGFTYIRFHGLLCDDMGVYQEDESGTPIYNFQYIDMVYDEILKIGMKPFVEFGFMPNALASGTQTVFWWKANVTVPSDYIKWRALIVKLTEHWIIRYGLEEVSSWLFEVWNEPNHPAFFTTKLEDYLPLYQETANAIKSVSQNLQVGGPATAGNAWVPELIAYCHQNHIPLDFISTHNYCTKIAFDEFGVKQFTLSEDVDAIVNGARKVHRQIKESSMPELPLHYTEWSSSPSSRDFIHDCYIEAPFILYNLKRLAPYVASMSYWTFTDIFEESGIGPSPFHGGFGLMNQQSIKKSAYYAYQFLNRMGEIQLLCTDEDSFVCKDQTGNIQVLFWSYQLPSQDDVNQKYFRQDLLPKEKKHTELALSGLPERRYRLTHYQTGYRVNDPYTEYILAGFEDLSNPQREKYLKALSDGRPVEERAVQVDENRTLNLQIDGNLYDCHLLILCPLG